MKLYDMIDSGSVTRMVGCVKPKGLQYIPESIDEYKYILSKANRFGISGQSFSVSSRNVLGVEEFKKTYDFLEFYIESTLFYINNYTFESDIRDKIINKLL